MDVHNTFAVEQHRAAEQGMLVHKGVAGDFIGQLHIRLRRVLGALLRLAIEGGVVHLQMSGNEDTVRRDFVTGLEQDLVADHHVVHIDDDHNAVPVNFTLVFLGAVFQLAVLGITGHAGFGRNKGHNQHRHNGTGRFVDIRVAKGKHDDHQCRNGQQNADHGVLEGLLEFRPKGGGFRIGNHVAAVFLSRFLHLGLVQSVKVHGHSPRYDGKEEEWYHSLLFANDWILMDIRAAPHNLTRELGDPF